MNDIKAIAEDRANLAALVEYLKGLQPVSRDPDEAAAHQLAVRRAELAYERAETNFQKAVATLTVAELAAMGLVA